MGGGDRNLPEHSVSESKKRSEIEDDQEIENRNNDLRAKKKKRRRANPVTSGHAQKVTRKGQWRR